VRPLQSIVALFDGKVLNGEVLPGGQMAPIAFGATTRGHRFLSKGTIEVASFADYVAKLRSAHVILDAAERKRIILEGARRLCAEAQVTLNEDEGLLEEVAGLTEWPVPMLGGIDDQFMEVPPEVLIVSMKVHLRFFTTSGADGKLANRFVVVANNVARDGGKTIVAGNERVLRGRLADAKFFWDQDRRTTLESRLPALNQIVFHAKLGTQAERVERIRRLATLVADRHPEMDQALVDQAARLCKADLVTGMVGEFPELQGVMGRYYALGEKLPASVADAIGDHYAPAGPNDRCPTAPVSIAVALADKLDTLMSFWSIGEKPTGSRDPFALRRAALGVIRIVLEGGLRLPIRDIAGDELVAFFADRLKVLLREQGRRHDLVDAVFALGDDDLVRIVARVEALDGFLTTEDGANLLAGYKRATNILRAEEKKGALPDGPAAAMDGAPGAELALVQALSGVEPAVADALAAEDFVAAMQALAGLRGPVDAFFEQVLVNAEDPAERDNRLRLLSQVRDAMGRVADFSQVTG